MLQPLRVNSGTTLRCPVSARRELLQADLRTYGEDELAARIVTLSEAEMQRIGEVADHYLYLQKAPIFS